MAWRRGIPIALTLLACGGESEPAGPGGAGGDGGGGGLVSEAGAELSCPPGELALDDGSCLAAGVPSDGCGVGFVHDGDGACEATLPADACPEGSMARPGESSCVAIAPCGAGSWGDIPVASDTQHVDASYSGPSTGSAAQPFSAIQEAIDAAADGAIVAIAAGSYSEDVVVDHPVTLWGVCPQQAALVGAGASAALRIVADDVTVRALSISGPLAAISMSGSKNVVLGQLWIHDAGDYGITAGSSDGSGSFLLEDSLIENVTQIGVISLQSDVAIVDSVIRDVAASANGDWGTGVAVYGPALDTASLSMSGSVIARSKTFGITTQGSMTSVIEDSLVIDVDPAEATGFDGLGVWMRWETADGPPASLSITGSVIEDTHFTGVGAWGGEMNLTRTTVRDVAQDMSAGGWGAGVRYFDVEPVAGTPPSGRMVACTVDRAHRVGVELWGAEASLQSVLVRDPKPKADGAHGFGVIAFVRDDTLQPSDLSLVGSRIERASQGGVIVSGSRGVIDATAVLDTQPRQADGAFGVGISILTELATRESSSAELRQTVVDGAYAGGIVLGGGDASLTDVIVRNVAPQVNVDDFGDGIGASSTMVILPGIYPATLSITRATVEGVPRAAVSSFGASVTVAGSLLECNGIDLDGENIEGATFDFDDAGDNDCGCADQRDACKVLTTNIEPPLAL